MHGMVRRGWSWEMKAHLVLLIPRIADEAGGRPCRHHFREAASSKSPVGISPSANESIIRVRSRNSSTLSNTYSLLTVSMALTGLVMSSPKKSNNTACSQSWLVHPRQAAGQLTSKGQEKKKSKPSQRPASCRTAIDSSHLTLGAIIRRVTCAAGR